MHAGSLVLAALAGTMLAQTHAAGIGWRVVAVATGVPSAFNLLLTARRAAAETVGNAIREALLRPGSRLAVEVLAVLVGLIGYVFSPLGALLSIAWLVLAGVVVARFRGTDALLSRLGDAALTGGAIALSLGLAEGFLRLPSVARQLGPPSELAAWYTRRYDHLWDHNLFGFRSQHETVSRRPGVFRVLALGDSFTWGDKIAQSDSIWPALLEAQLRTKLPGKDVEVINMGRRGFTTANEAELLRRIGWQFHPDLVLIQWLVNDALPSGPNFQHELEDWLVPPHPLLPWVLLTGAVQESALFFLVQQRYDRLRARVPTELAYGSLYREGSIGWTETRAALAEIGDSARAEHVPVVLVIFPLFIPGSWTPETHPHHAIHQLVRDAAEAAHLGVFDLTPVFAKKGGDWYRWWATPYDMHPSIAAHKLVAATLSGLVTSLPLAPNPDQAGARDRGAGGS